MVKFKGQILLILALQLANNLKAQSPQLVNYQAVVRNNAGQPIQNQSVSLKFSILEKDTNGLVLFSELHHVTTNSLGLVNVKIGGGNATIGALSKVPWQKNNSKYLKIEIDPAGGSNFAIISTSQLISVPYSLFALKSDTALNLGDSFRMSPATLQSGGASVGQILIWDGKSWAPKSITTDSTLIGYGTKTLPLALSDMRAKKGQILIWNGKRWIPGNVYIPSGDTSATNELQNLNATKSANLIKLNISGGNTVYLNVADQDSSETNELQTLSKNGGRIQLSKSGNIIFLNDSSSTNELQNLSKSGSKISLSQGGGTFDNNDADADSTNEIQQIYVTNDTIFLSKGGGSLKTPASNLSWKTAGNSGTSPSSEFLGTTDNKDLVFRTNNIQSGRMFSSNSNLALGDSAMGKFLGGSNNIGIGYKSMFNLNYGINNIGMGYRTLYSNNGGDENIAFGYNAMSANTNGYQNIAFGVKAMFANTTGAANLAIGFEALLRNKSGVRNLALGQDALANNTTGQENIGQGFEVMYNNTVGYGNIGIGNHALYNSKKSYYDIGIGYQALVNDTSGGNNIGIGLGAGYYTRTGENNTTLGTNAYNSGQAAYNNTTTLGYLASPTGSNRVFLGNSSVVGIYAQVTSISSISDARVKENVDENVPGLEFINKLRPVAYNINIHKQNKFLYDSAQNASHWIGQFDIEKIRFNGLIAQEVEKVMNETGAKFTGLEKPNQNDPLYHIKYGDLIMPLVKSIQEQQKLIDLQTKEIATLKSQVELLLMKK